MANVAEQMAAMMAAARPQQAPAPGRPNVVTGGGALKSKAVSANLNIDIGYILDKIAKNKEKHNELLRGIQAQYSNDLLIKDRTAVDQEFINNKALQEIAKQAYESGDPGFTQTEITVPRTPPEKPFIDSKTDPQEAARIGAYYERQRSVYQAEEANNPERKLVYLPKQIAPTKKEQEAAAFGRASESTKQRLLEPNRPETNVLGEIGVTPEQRQKYFKAKMALERAGRVGRGAKGNKKLAAANLAWNKYIQQAIADPKLQIDDEATNYASYTKIAARALQHINDVKAAGGTPNDSVGAVKVVGELFSKEMPPNKAIKQGSAGKSQMMRYNNYMDQFYRLLREAGGVDISEHARLMDWLISIRGGQGAVDFFASKGLKPEQINEIYQYTKAAARAARVGNEEVPNPDTVSDKAWYNKPALKSISSWKDFFESEDKLKFLSDTYKNTMGKASTEIYEAVKSLFSEDEEEEKEVPVAKGKKATDLYKKLQEMNK